MPVNTNAILESLLVQVWCHRLSSSLLCSQVVHPGTLAENVSLQLPLNPVHFSLRNHRGWYTLLCSLCLTGDFLFLSGLWMTPSFMFHLNYIFHSKPSSSPTFTMEFFVISTLNLDLPPLTSQGTFRLLPYYYRAAVLEYIGSCIYSLATNHSTGAQ